MSDCVIETWAESIQIDYCSKDGISFYRYDGEEYNTLAQACRAVERNVSEWMGDLKERGRMRDQTI